MCACKSHRETLPTRDWIDYASDEFYFIFAVHPVDRGERMEFKNMNIREVLLKLLPRLDIDMFTEEDDDVEDYMKLVLVSGEGWHPVTEGAMDLTSQELEVFKGMTVGLNREIYADKKTITLNDRCK